MFQPYKQVIIRYVDQPWIPLQQVGVQIERATVIIRFSFWFTRRRIVYQMLYNNPRIWSWYYWT